MSNEKILAVTLTVVMVFSVFSATVFVSSQSASAAQTQPRFEIVDVGNTGGDLRVTVQATSTEPVENFKFWYDDLDGTSAGPTRLSDSAIYDARYGDGTAFTTGDTVYQGHPNSDNVTFFFDSGTTDYDYQADAFRINATAYDATYTTADTGNRSVMTANHYRVNAQDHNGDPLSNVPLMQYDANTNASLGFNFLQTGSLTYHCHGVDVGGTCTDPDTGNPSTLTDGFNTVAAPLSVEIFSLSESNASGKTDLSQGSTTLTADTPTSPTFIWLESVRQGGPRPAAKSIEIVASDSGNTVYQESDIGSSTQAPVFLRPNTEYEVTLENSSSFGTITRSLTLPTKGMSDVSFRVPTTQLDTSRVSGQIVDESGNPVSNAVVIAQPEYASGSRINVYNSTTTDSNGLFSMRLPETSQLNSEYGFRIIGTDTNGGTPIYYPTTDANDGEGYVVQSSTTVVPAMTLQQGGRVDIDVSNKAGGQLPTGFAFTSLSQVSSAYPDATRTATSNGFSTFSFGQRPNSAAVSLMSPTTDASTQVTYNIWGLQNSPTGYLCAGAPSVSQGSATSETCKLEQAGYLNLSLQRYDSIVKQQSSSYENVEDVGFFFRNTLVVRDANTGDVVTYLGPDGIQQVFAHRDGRSTSLTVPVPPGDYQVELRPASDFAPATSVNDTSTVTVSAGGTQDVTLDRGSAFATRPVFSRTQGSFNRAADNTIAVRVHDPADGSVLTDTDATVTAFLKHPNGTLAHDPVELTYNSTDRTFDTKTFKPSSLGVDAGSYRISIRTSHSAGSRTYNSSISGPIQVSGFQTGIQLGSRSVGPGESVIGQIHAYDTSADPDQPIDANSASQITISVYDQNGRQVSRTNPSSGFTGGQGSFSLTMPDEPGRYRIATRVTSDGGEQGIAERWVRVSQIDLDVSTDRTTYTPSDTVAVDVEATDSTNGNPIRDASITLRVNGKRTSAVTDSNGEARIRLDPGTYASGTGWQSGHGIGVELAHETSDSIVRKTGGTFFEVQTFDARAQPTKRSFTPSESAVLEVQVPQTASVTSVAVTELDGESVRIGGDPGNSAAVTNPSAGVYRVDLGKRSVGEHLAELTVRTESSGSETATTQFAVERYSISASLDQREYETGETMTLDVSVRQPDGTVVSGQRVDASLNTTSPVRSVDSASGTTDSSGELSLSLSSSQSGFHFVEVQVGQQTRHVGLSVSNVDVRLEDGNRDPVSEYRAEPGTSQTIYVNATAGGTAVTDDSTVTAFISSYGETIELGNNQTTAGKTNVEFQIPSSVPADEYDLFVHVTTASSGSGTTSGVLNVTGANARQIEASTNESGYSAGATARLSATVTAGDGSPIANEPVDFVVQSDGTADRRVATVQTDADGNAVYDYDVPAGADDGQYVLEAVLNDTRSIKSYTGFRVRSIDVTVEAGDGPFEPGDSVPLTIHATDSATGDPVTATGGSVRISLPGNSVEETLSLSGDAPYDVSVSLPNDGSITGTRSITATIQRDRSTDSDSTLIDVRDGSESANLSIAKPVTAGQATTVTVNGTVDATAVLTAYSPGADTVAYNGSVSMSSSSDTTTQMTIDSPGTHVVRLSVPGVGALTEVIDVEPASGNPTVWTGTSTSRNATEFTSSEDVYISTNEPGMTATVISPNSTYTVELDSQDGSNYYGVLSTNRPNDVYLVRLDSDSATGIDDAIIEVDG